MTQNLNPAQEQAVRKPADAPLLIVAGAGTGKTKTLTTRLIHLIEQGVKPDRICALTFTNKAAKEMADRTRSAGRWPASVHQRDIFGSPGPFLGTFHSFGSRILRQEARLLGRTPQFVIYDDSDSFQLLKNVLKANRIDREDAPPGEVAGLISALKNGMKKPEDLASERSRTARAALDMFPRYEDGLRTNNAFDFDDLIDKVVALFESHPDVLARYRERFTHMLVDEYQDLNNRQYDLLRLLCGEHMRISVVGDDQQSIYGWRGSNFEIFMNFERDWPGAHVVVLDQNYRSTSNIITAASAVIANNGRQKPKKLWTENASGELITLIEAGDEEDEAVWIADTVRTAHAERPEETIAVLYRTNAQSRPIEQALIARRIPYRIYGGIKFYERREIKDLVAALRLAVNPQDSVSRERLEKAFTKATFRELVAILQTSANLPPAELIEAVIDATDYFSYILKNLTNISDRRENIAELVRFAAAFDDTSALLEQAALVQATDDKSADDAGKQPTVTLMTIHMAKGLEFDRVFIAGCAEGLLPHGRALYSERETEEERRLMYVAMTRARKHLAISFCDIPSRFVSEIPQELMEFRSLISDETKFSDGEERYISYD